MTTADATRHRRKPSLKLARGTLRCAITKGRFDFPEEPERRVVDVFARMQRDALGLPGAAGQPDVVLSFWLVTAPERVLFAIADAKRNVTGDGIAYLKRSIATMAAYMVAFAEPLGVRLSAEHGGLAAPLMPTATLFLRQGAGASDSAPANWLQCLGPQHYARTQDDAWQPSGLQKWFSRLSASADRALRAPGQRAS